MTVIDFCYRMAYKIAYPVMVQFRRTNLRRHDGVSVAVWCKDSVLMVKHSYRSGILLPGGGINSGEDPRICVSRELREEVGFTVDIDGLRLVDRRSRRSGVGQISLYEISIDQIPEIMIDNREIVFAGFIQISDVDSEVKNMMMRDYLRKKKLEKLS